EGRDDIRDHSPDDHRPDAREGEKARTADPDPPRVSAAAGDDQKPEFSVAALGVLVDLTGGNLDPFHDQLEVVDGPFDRGVHVALGGHDHPRVVDVDLVVGRTGLDLVQHVAGLQDDPRALPDLLEADHEPVVVVAVLTHRHVEIAL